MKDDRSCFYKKILYVCVIDAKAQTSLELLNVMSVENSHLLILNPRPKFGNVLGDAHQHYRIISYSNEVTKLRNIESLMRADTPTKNVYDFIKGVSTHLSPTHYLAIRGWVLVSTLYVSKAAEKETFVKSAQSMPRSMMRSMPKNSISHHRQQFLGLKLFVSQSVLQVTALDANRV